MLSAASASSIVRVAALTKRNSGGQAEGIDAEPKQHFHAGDPEEPEQGAGRDDQGVAAGSGAPAPRRQRADAMWCPIAKLRAMKPRAAVTRRRTSSANESACITSSTAHKKEKAQMNRTDRLYQNMDGILAKRDLLRGVSAATTSPIAGFSAADAVAVSERAAIQAINSGATAASNWRGQSASAKAAYAATANAASGAT